MSSEISTPGVREVLGRIVGEYGRNALTDPVALRAAWRATAGGGEPPAEILVVAAHADRAGPPELRAGWVDDVVTPAAQASGLPADRLRPAARLLAEALTGHGAQAAKEPDATEPGADDPRTGDPTVDPRMAVPEADGHRITWEDEQSGPVAPDGARTGRFPRRTVLLAAAGAVLVAAAAAVVPRLGGGDDGPAAGEDRYAVAAVADRYRSLGADLLAGAVRCARDAERPGEVERVRCDVDGLVVVLRTFDGPDAMRGARAAAIPPGDTVRSARRVRDDGAVALSEQRSGQSTVAWDAQVPRPVGATVTAPMSLVDLATFHDRRRFGLVPRPEVPGPMFRSGALWSLAASYVDNDPTFSCRAVIPEADELEAVECPRTDGGGADYTLLRDRAALQRIRTEFADDDGFVPGSRSVRSWARGDGPTVGQIAQFVNLARRPGLFYDDDALLGYGLMYGRPGQSQGELFQFWSGKLAPG